MIIRFLTYIILTIGLNLICHSQDIHFSQLNLSPRNLNPAMTGAFKGDYRFAGNHRNQWSSVTVPYTTYALSAEKNHCLILPLSLGFQINQDRAGDSRFNTFQINTSAAYELKIDSIQKFKIGTQIGYTKKNLDYTPLSFDAQYNGTIYDPFASNQENFNSNSNSYLNFNIGLGHFLKVSKKLELQSGIAIYNMNSGRESYFQDNQIGQQPRLAIHTKGSWRYSEKLLFHPTILWLKQGKHQQTVLTLQSEYVFENFMNTYRSVIAGLSYRNKDALFLNAGYRLDSWQLGISYDVNLSKLIPASQLRGGFEIAVIYIINQSPPKKIIHRICPDYL